MIRPLTAALFVLLCITTLSASAKQKPLPVRNQMPMSAVFLDFVPLSAYALGKGEVEGRLSYHVANMVMCESENGVTMRMDMEAHSLLADLAYGLSERTTLRTSFGYRWHTGGILDSKIEEVEKILGRQTPWARRRFEKNGTDWWTEEDGNFTFECLEPTRAVTDLNIELNWQATLQRNWLPAGAFRLGIKIPTAPKRNAMGTGGMDWGAGVAASWEYGAFSTHINLDGAFVADHKGLAKTAFEDTDKLLTATLAQVVGFGKRWEAVLQADIRNNPYNTTIDSIIEEQSIEIHLGVRRHLAVGGNWFLVLTENTSDKASPDFGILLGVEIRRVVGSDL